MTTETTERESVTEGEASLTGGFPTSFKSAEVVCVKCCQPASCEEVAKYLERARKSEPSSNP